MEQKKTRLDSVIYSQIELSIEKLYFFVIFLRGEMANRKWVIRGHRIILLKFLDFLKISQNLFDISQIFRKLTSTSTEKT